jgi:hypothetical protein
MYSRERSDYQQLGNSAHELVEEPFAQPLGDWVCFVEAEGDPTFRALFELKDSRAHQDAVEEAAELARGKNFSFPFERLQVGEDPLGPHVELLDGPLLYRGGHEEVALERLGVRARERLRERHHEDALEGLFVESTIRETSRSGVSVVDSPLLRIGLGTEQTVRESNVFGAAKDRVHVNTLHRGGRFLGLPNDSIGVVAAPCVPLTVGPWSLFSDLGVTNTPGS